MQRTNVSSSAAATTASEEPSTEEPSTDYTDLTLSELLTAHPESLRVFGCDSHVLSVIMLTSIKRFPYHSWIFTNLHARITPTRSNALRLTITAPGATIQRALPQEQVVRNAVFAPFHIHPYTDESFLQSRRRTHAFAQWTRPISSSLAAQVFRELLEFH